jgi:hypothetical protein
MIIGRRSRNDGASAGRSGDDRRGASVVRLRNRTIIADAGRSGDDRRSTPVVRLRDRTIIADDTLGWLLLDPPSRRRLPFARGRVAAR